MDRGSRRKQMFKQFRKRTISPTAPGSRPNHWQPRRGKLCFEQLEDRLALSISAVEPLGELEITVDTGKKPQSKVWQHDNTWWMVASNETGTFVHRLDGIDWTAVLQISDQTYVKSDVKSLGEVVHILVNQSEEVATLASVQYIPGTPGTYQPWSLRPGLTTISIESETATIDIDSTGRLWLAYDTLDQIQVRYSDVPYTSFSDGIVLAPQVDEDDISVVTALPDGTVGVLWSNQTTERFGFRVHVDGADPAAWSADEVPAAQSALNVGNGMADDHLNVAVAADGTLYAAIKTSYDAPGLTSIGLLVRRPDSTWDPLHTVDTVGTRAIVQLNETTGNLLVTYRLDESEPIVYRQASTTDLLFGPRTVLFTHPKHNDPSSTKDNFTEELVIIASQNGILAGARLISAPPADDPWEIVSFQDGQFPTPAYSGTRDTTLWVDAPTANFGTDDELEMDGLPDLAALVAWDVSSIPAGSRVQQATISFNVTNRTDDLYEIYPLLVAWHEMEATWNQRAADSPWEIPGASGTADRGITALGEIISLDTGPLTIELNAAGLAVVQAWIDNPGSNYGIVIQDYIGADNGIRLDAREAAVAANRPKLNITYLPPAPGQNLPPSVDAGPDQAVSIADPLNLAGMVTDDGLPAPASLSVSWHMESGPGNVVFANPMAAATTASFSAPGTYVLRLSADDGEFAVFDETTVTVSDGAVPVTVSFQDGMFPAPSYSGTRDATIGVEAPSENFGADSALEIDGLPDIAALIAWDINSIPAGSRVEQATISFHVTNRTDDLYEIYPLLLPWHELEATWNQRAADSPWEIPGVSGTADRGFTTLGGIISPDTGPLTIELNAAGLALVQSWIDNPGSNHGVVLQDYTGADNGIRLDAREAAVAANRPKLTITYVLPAPGQNLPPTVDAGPDQTIVITDPLTLPGTVNDDGLPAPTSLAVSWSMASGPGIVTFADPAVAGTTASFSTPGSYVLRLTADDGEFSVFDETTVTVGDSRIPIMASFQDGVFPTPAYLGTRDTMIRSAAPAANFASAATLTADGDPDDAVLLRWDISTIPPGSEVAAASITLSVTNRTTDLYEFYEVLRPWNEAETTWLEFSTGQAWEIAGVQGSVDRGAVVLGQLTAPLTGVITIELNAAGVAVVQKWIDDPASNFGLIFQDYLSADNGFDLDSREAAGIGSRPKLSIVYFEPPAPIQSLQMGDPAIAGTATALVIAGSWATAPSPAATMLLSQSNNTLILVPAKQPSAASDTVFSDDALDDCLDLQFTDIETWLDFGPPAEPLDRLLEQVEAMPRGWFDLES